MELSSLKEIVQWLKMRVTLLESLASAIIKDQGYSDSALQHDLNEMGIDHNGQCYKKMGGKRKLSVFWNQMLPIAIRNSFHEPSILKYKPFTRKYSFLKILSIFCLLLKNFVSIKGLEQRGVYHSKNCWWILWREMWPNMGQKWGVMHISHHWVHSTIGSANYQRLIDDDTEYRMRAGKEPLLLESCNEYSVDKIALSMT